MKLTPKQIFTELMDKSINKPTGIEKLISIVEKSNDHDERMEALNIFKILHFNDNGVFNLLENLLISDSSEKIRKISAEIIRDDFLDLSYIPMEWTLKHEPSPQCLKVIYDTLILALKKLENQENIFSKKVLISLINKIEKKDFLVDLTILKKQKILSKLANKELIEILINYYTIIYFEKVYWRIRYDIENFRITKLNFIFKGLINLPVELQNLHSLKSLVFRYNQISSIPDWIGSLKSLEVLNFNVNEIDKLPASIRHLQSLKELYLWKNNLEELPNTIGSLKSLQILNLRLNFLSTLPSTIKYLKSLRNLNLHDNRLILLPDSIGELINLRKINLSWNKLKAIPPSIGRLRFLKTLDIGRNELKNLPNSLGNLQSLEILNLSENKLTSLPNKIKNLKNLKQLNIFRNKLTELPEEIENLTNLEELYIGENYIDNFSKLLKVLESRGVKIFF